MTFVAENGCRRLYRREVRNLDKSWFHQFIGIEEIHGIDLPEQVFASMKAAMDWLNKST